MNNKKTIRYFYQCNDGVMFLENDDDFVQTITKQNKYLTVLDYNYYEMFSDYEMSLNGLQKFREDFKTWLIQYFEGLDMKIDYFMYYDIKGLTLCSFRDSERKNFFTLRKNEKRNSDLKEFINLEGCHNGGLIYLDPMKIEKTTKCYGSDFSSYYANLLSNEEINLQIPIKKPKFIKLDNLDFDNLKYGIYDVQIYSDSKSFLKVFSISPENKYTHYSLKFAFEYKELFNIKIELITDVEFNAMIYENDCVVYAKDLFKSHIDKLLKVKKKYPKNGLVKHMLRSFWGYLSEYKKKYILDDDMKNYSISYWNDYECKSEYKIIDEKYYYVDGYNLKTEYIAVNGNMPYRYYLGRMKPFITSRGRDYIARLIMKENIIDNIIRVQTDGIVLDKQHDFSNNKYYPIPEKKSTGQIKFYNVNNYYHVCCQCNNEYRYRDGHVCPITS